MVVAPDPIAISATHGPEPFRRGQTGNTLTLTVTAHGLGWKDQADDAIDVEAVP